MTATQQRDRDAGCDIEPAGCGIGTRTEQRDHGERQRRYVERSNDECDTACKFMEGKSAGTIFEGWRGIGTRREQPSCMHNSGTTPAAATFPNTYDALHPPLERVEVEPGRGDTFGADWE